MKSKFKIFYSQSKRLDLTNQEKTIVILPSLSFDEDSLKGIVGVEHYETRALWEILKAQNIKTKIICLTSYEIHNAIVNYICSFADNPEEIKKRITFINPDSKNKSFHLTDSIYQDSNLLIKIKSLIAGKKNAYLNPFVLTKKEEHLANKLEIPVLGCSSKLDQLKTKSGNRKIFKRAKVPCAKGEENIKNLISLYRAIIDLWKKCPNSKKFIIKLDQGVSGHGNAFLNFKSNYHDFLKLTLYKKKKFLLRSLQNLKFHSPRLTWDKFKAELKNGCVVEEFIEAKVKFSPSGQGFISPDGKVEVLSTHEQILDSSGMTFLGSQFPAHIDHRREIQLYTYKIGKILQTKGMNGYYGVDFLTIPKTINTENSLWAIEINIRQGGTTHPYQTTALLTQSTFNHDKGTLVDKNGREFYYRSNDNFLSESLIGIEINHFIKNFSDSDIHFCKKRKTGVVMHMLNAVNEYGKFGYTAIGNTLDEAELYHLKVKLVVDQITRGTQKNKLAQ